MAGMKVYLDKSNFLVKWQIGSKKIGGEVYKIVQTESVFSEKQAFEIAEAKRRKAEVVVYKLVKDNYVEIKRLSKIERKRRKEKLTCAV